MISNTNDIIKQTVSNFFNKKIYKLISSNLIINSFETIIKNDGYELSITQFTPGNKKIFLSINNSKINTKFMLHVLPIGLFDFKKTGELKKKEEKKVTEFVTKIYNIFGQDFYTAMNEYIINKI